MAGGGGEWMDVTVLKGHDVSHSAADRTTQGLMVKDPLQFFDGKCK